VQILTLELENYQVESLAEQGSKGMMGHTALKIECEQLRKDNSKLITMLKSTKEFEHFSFNIEEGGYAV
jgi:hypothetical protein